MRAHTRPEPTVGGISFGLGLKRSKRKEIKLTLFLPQTSLNGPQTMGERPMKSIYRALDRPMMEPVVLYVAATSGTAESTVVEEMGARKEQYDSRATMTSLRCCGMRSYTESGTSTKDV